MQFSKWLRKNEKKLLVIITVLIAVSFGLGSILPSAIAAILSWFSGEQAAPGNQAPAEIFGEPVPWTEFAPFARRWDRSLNVNMDVKELWSMYAAVRLAKRLGIRVSDAELQALVTSNRRFFDDPDSPSGKFSLERYRTEVARSGLTQQAFEQTLRELLAVHALQQLYADAILPTSAEVWLAFRRGEPVPRALPYQTGGAGRPIRNVPARGPGDRRGGPGVP